METQFFTMTDTNISFSTLEDFSPELSMQDLAEQVQKAFAEQLARVREQPSPELIEKLRLAYLGRKGMVPALYGRMKGLTKEERPVAGKALNSLKTEVEREVEALLQAGKAWLIQQRLEHHRPDITLGTPIRKGALHPVSLIRQKAMAEFARMGFSVYDGPECENDYYNFTALNTLEDHPARDMQDTFYLENDPTLLLRSHTSNNQIHTMAAVQPPLRIIAPGRVYRCDSDPTHSPLFHQIEALVVAEGIGFAHLKGTIDHFLKAIFGAEFKTRLRPSYFPFVEPGAEIDLYSPKAGWLEIGGCGMVHPNVFENVGLDSERYTGFAFGFGLDRMAMLRYGLPDLRQLFSGDSEYLGQFPCVSV